MQFHPFSSVSSLVCSSGKGGGGGGGNSSDETKKYNTKGSCNLINLELEVGGGLVGKSNFVVFGEEEEEEKEKGNILFTDAQFQELYLQVVIFKYLSSGLSVPFHLLLRICSSSSSFSISSGCSGFSPPLFIHRRRRRRTTMDLEPGRCRRTDGKKWRCYRNVVPDQKYCERHMHRGSHRSRKLVEAASKKILKSKINQEYHHLSGKKSRSRSSSSSSSIFNSRTSSVPNGGISVPVSTTLYLTPPSVTIAECSSSTSTAIISSLLKAQDSNNISTRNASNWNDSSRNNSIGKSSCVAAGFGVSPKSVLQGDGDTGYRNTGTQNESLRCRRTDGKRWRCSKMVVPCKKYCENHLHRGSKKAATTMATKTTVAGGSFCVQKKKKKKEEAEMVSNYSRELDINLSMSILPNNYQQNFDNNSSSRSSSDATTVSDENVCRFRTL